MSENKKSAINNLENLLNSINGPNHIPNHELHYRRAIVYLLISIFTLVMGFLPEPFFDFFPSICVLLVTLVIFMIASFYLILAISSKPKELDPKPPKKRKFMVVK